MADYVPEKDGPFDAWQANWMTYAVANATALQIAATRITQLQAFQAAWRAGYDDLGVKTAAKESATQVKTQVRAPYEAALREESQILQDRGSTTNDQRAGLQITFPMPSRRRPARRPPNRWDVSMPQSALSTPYISRTRPRPRRVPGRRAFRAVKSA